MWWYLIIVLMYIFVNSLYFNVSCVHMGTFVYLLHLSLSPVTEQMAYSSDYKGRPSEQPQSFQAVPS